MNKNDFLRHRMKKYLHKKDLKALADKYLPVHSDYFSNPELFSKKDAILKEIDQCSIIENNYEAILLKVDTWLA